MTKDLQKNLFNIIVCDVIHTYKTLIILFLMIFTSSLLVIIFTYKTRALSIKNELLLKENNCLQQKCRILLLEKNKLLTPNRISNIAINKLHMKYIDVTKEKIILEKKGFHNFNVVFNKKMEIKKK